MLYDAGVDTHMHDSLGKLNLTDKGLRRRELQVGAPTNCKNLPRAAVTDALSGRLRHLAHELLHGVRT